MQSNWLTNMPPRIPPKYWPCANWMPAPSSRLRCAAIGYTLGIASSLIFGTGMCLAMGQIGSASPGSFVLGIIVGLLGMAGMGINYPLYKRILTKGKQKYTYEIVELAREISEQ